MKELIEKFINIAKETGYSIKSESVEYEKLKPPHGPNTNTKPKHNLATSNKGAIYVFCSSDNNDCLKVGVAGPGSHNRLWYQHYNENGANSTLAASIRLDNKSVIGSCTPGKWVKTKTIRHIFYVDYENKNDLEKYLLPFFEKLAALKLKPKYEGVKNRKKTSAIDKALDDLVG